MLNFFKNFMQYKSPPHSIGSGESKKPIVEHIEEPMLEEPLDNLRLGKYFLGTSTIVYNGIEYRFFSDINYPAVCKASIFCAFGLLSSELNEKFFSKEMMIALENRFLENRWKDSTLTYSALSYEAPPAPFKKGKIRDLLSFCFEGMFNEQITVKSLMNSSYLGFADKLRSRSNADITSAQLARGAAKMVALWLTYIPERCITDLRDEEELSFHAQNSVDNTVRTLMMAKQVKDYYDRFIGTESRQIELLKIQSAVSIFLHGVHSALKSQWRYTELPPKGWGIDEIWSLILQDGRSILAENIKVYTESLGGNSPDVVAQQWMDDFLFAARVEESDASNKNQSVLAKKTMPLISEDSESTSSLENLAGVTKACLEIATKASTLTPEQRAKAQEAAHEFVKKIRGILNENQNTIS